MTSDRSRMRLFFALPADGAGGPLRQVHEQLAAFPRLLKPVAPGQYHITLKFLGETDTDICRRLSEDVRKLDPGVTAQPYAMKGLGAFPGIRRPRVIWCGLDLDVEALMRIQRSIEELCAAHGFNKEPRPFTPHLTLARVRVDARLPEELTRFMTENAATPYGESRFDRIVLFKSELRREGPVYTALEELRLG
jgi:RNA 2',3'-cyclic 3'-phosphodiesterase